jgi:hypothetical protein
MGVKLVLSHSKGKTQIVRENRVLRRIFRPKREEVAGGWRRLHNEELHNLYTSPDIIRVIKARGVRLAGRVERMGQTKKCIQYFWVENLKGRDFLEDPGGNERIILEWMLGK